MTELERLEYNINGQEPRGTKSIIIVNGLDNPKEDLESCKEVIKVLLQHNDISKKSSKWRELFPERYIKFFDLIEDRDLENDELLYTMPLVIGDFQDLEIRKWQWYSCKLSDHGFEIVMEGRFNPMFLWFIHYLGIPYSKIWLTSDTREKYQFRTIKDVTTYKKIE